jgi:hypothetical protein
MNCTGNSQHPILFSFYVNHIYFTCTYLSSYLLKHLANTTILARLRVRLSLLPTLLPTIFHIVSSVFVLAHPAACVSQRLIFHMCISLNN